jgi:N-acetylneuraminate lyase
MTNPLVTATNRILPALVTPLTPEGRLDVPSAERLVDRLYRDGVGGLYVLGSTGEGVFLDFEIRRQLAELCVKLSRGRGQVILHVAAVQASMAYELAHHAAEIGADAIASIPPFVGGYGWEEVQDYYRQLTAARLPVVAYHIPAITGQAVSLDRLASVGEIPGVAGFKFTDTNLYLMQRLLTRLSPDQVLYNGPDEMLALGLAMGAHGGIGTTYNFMPRQILQIAAHAAAGRWAEAVALQKQINEVIEILLSFPALAATKQILEWQGLIDCPRCAAPRALLSAEQQASLRQRLSATFLAETLVCD